MGVEFRESRILEAKAQKIVGCPVELPFPSVGATENLILAAVLAEGETRIKGAAMEPEIFELCRFLKAMGCLLYTSRQHSALYGYRAAFYRRGNPGK